MIDYGLLLAVVGSLITLIGVHVFNQGQDSNKARYIWAFSNPIFALYFIGRCAGLWDGGLSDGVMAGIYLYMTGSNYLALYRELKDKINMRLKKWYQAHH